MRIESVIPTVGQTEMNFDEALRISSVDHEQLPGHATRFMLPRGYVRVTLNGVTVTVLASDLIKATQNAVNR